MGQLKRDGALDSNVNGHVQVYDTSGIISGVSPYTW